MKSRMLVLGTMLAVALAILPAHSQGPTTITWSTLATGGPVVAKVYRALAQQFERQNPNVRVNVQIQPGKSEEQLNRYVTLFAARDPSVDIISIDIIWPAQMAAAGWLAPLDQWFTPAARDGFLPGAIRANTIGGRIYGMPWYTDAGLFYARADLLQKYNARMPQTWDELIQTAQRITAGEANPNIAGFLFQGARIEALASFFFEVLWSNGGDILDANGKVIVDNGGGQAALNFMLDLVRRHRITPPGVTTLTTDDTRVAFQNGRVAFMRNWTDAYGFFQGEGSAVKDKVAIAPLPRGSVRSASTLGGWQLAISNFSRNKEIAWRFLEFMSGRVGQKSMAMQVSTVPTRKDIFEDAQGKRVQPHFPDMLRIALNARPRPQIADYPRLSTIVQTNVQAALTNQITADEAVTRMAREICALLNQ
ncbi:MAG: ABC transporter substrate-binding protein [Armatimonadetes bacterium]|nr:ABC transporter substrate-binding protein [Armatimonadota bacterium]